MRNPRLFVLIGLIVMLAPRASAQEPVPTRLVVRAVAHSESGAFILEVTASDPTWANVGRAAYAFTR